MGNEDTGGRFEPRLITVSRRAFLQRGTAVGALLALPGLACSSSDAEVFAGDGESVAKTTTDAMSTTTTEADATSTTSTTESETTTEAEPAPAEPGTTALPAGGELIVAFTYEAADSGRVLNPYIAVWLEDVDGNLIDTISLWFLQQQPKGHRWLDDLRLWYVASDQGADTTMSSATRTAGSYTVAWDGTDLTGSPLAAGDYVLYIEAAREHGPYSVTSVPITLDGGPLSVAIPENGELTTASAEVSL